MHFSNKKHQCDARRLQSYLDQQLTIPEEAELELHLDECVTCRQQMSDRAAEPQWWTHAITYLTPDAWDEELGADATATSGTTDTRPEGTPNEALLRQLRDSLDPSDDPRYLGRFGGYEILGIIGHGGMGVVLKGFEPSLNRYVAIKVLSPSLATSGAARKRFAREAQAAAAVLHENVIAIHRVANAHDLPYLVMPYVGGMSLQKRIDEEGPLPLVAILRISHQIAAGLAAAHSQGLVHRDIKPANILLERGVERVTITDFGLARAADDGSLTKTGFIAGTPQYMSPEQARGESIGARSDLFSLGSVIYAMCTGHPPFRAETSYGILRRITDAQPRPIREVNPDVPEWLCQIIAKLISKSPDDRFESAHEVAELLEECLAHVQQPTAAPLPASLVLQAPNNGWTFTSHRKGVFAMLATFGFALLATVLLQAPEAPDDAGNAIGDESSAVVPDGKPFQSVAEVPFNKSQLPRVADNYQPTTTVLNGLVGGGGIIERIEDQTIYLRSGDRVALKEETVVILVPKESVRPRALLKPSQLEPGMAISYSMRDGKLEKLFLVGIVDQQPRRESAFDTIKRLGLRKVSETNDAVDTTHPIRLAGKNGEVTINAGDTKLVQLPGSMTNVKWQSGDYRPEEIEDFEPFDYLLVRWRDNGRITWTRYASPPTPPAGANDGDASGFLQRTGHVQERQPRGVAPRPLDGSLSQWPLYRGDPQMTGVAGASLADDLSLLWSFPVNKGAFESTAAIVDGVAYIGDLDGKLYALDMNTGEKKWEFVTGEEPAGFNSAPAVRDGLLYIGDRNGTFHCLQADEGKPVWRFETEGEINSSPNFYNSNVLIGSQDATLYCLNATSGELVWKNSIGDQIRCSPTIVGNRCLLAGCDGRLHIIDLDRGEQVADVPIDGPTGVTPAARGDLVYFGTENGTFYAVDWKKAEVVWRWEEGASGQGIRSSPAVTEELLVFGSRDKRLYALDRVTGKEQWSFLTRGRVDSSPVVAGTRAYTGSADGRVYGVDLATGEKAWEYEAGGRLLGSPAVADGKLVIASDAGVVYCFGEKKETSPKPHSIQR